MKSVRGTAQTEADLASEGILNWLWSVVFGVAAGRELTVTNFNTAHKSVCVQALKCVSYSITVAQPAAGPTEGYPSAQ